MMLKVLCLCEHLSMDFERRLTDACPVWLLPIHASKLANSQVT